MGAMTLPTDEELRAAFKEVFNTDPPDADFFSRIMQNRSIQNLILGTASATVIKNVPPDVSMGLALGSCILAGMYIEEARHGRKTVQ